MKLIATNFLHYALWVFVMFSELKGFRPRIHRMKYATRRALQDFTPQLITQNSLVSPSIISFFKAVASMKPCTIQEGQVSPSSVNSFGSSLLASTTLPSNKEEAWRFTNLGKLFSSLPSGQSWSSPMIPEEELSGVLDPSAYHIFIIDGILREDICNSIDARKTCELQVNWIGGGEDISNHMEKDKYFFLPEKNTLPRESFGSGLLTALNMVCYFFVDEQQLFIC